MKHCLKVKTIITSVLFLVTIPVGWSQSFNDVRNDINKHIEYNSIKEALKNPNEVYRLNLNNSNVNVNLLDKALPKFQNLRELRLSNTFIYEIPESIGKLQNLQILELEHLKEQNLNLTELPESIQNLKEIVSINLIGNPRVKWDATFLYLSTMPKLVNIAIMNNNLKHLPDNVIKLQALEMIWMGKNPQLDLKDTFLKLSEIKNLKHLGVGGSGYIIMPKELSLLKSIENLWLSGNNWRELDGIQHLPKLTQVSFNNCNLSEFPVELMQCKSIEYLSLAQNSKLNFDAVLKDIPNSVKILNLSNNGIKKISSVRLNKPKLEKLILTKNDLQDNDLLKFQNLNNNVKLILK